MRFRSFIIPTIVIASLVLLALIIFKNIHLHNPQLDDAQIYTLVGTVVQTTGTFGAVALAVMFLTAQFSGSGRPSVVRELYRSRDVYVLFGYAAATVLSGYMAMVTTGQLMTPWRDRVVDIVMVFGGASVLLLLPALISQLENLDQITLASKLAIRITPPAIIEYGLTDVQALPDKKVEFHIATVGLRPRLVDPLRPLHELVMEAVNVRDRVLFGKLFRCLLAPIAKVHGIAWDTYGASSSPHLLPTVPWRAIRASRVSLVEKTHVTLAILHYSVKRARNLLTEWERRDIGRHGILTGIGDLIKALAFVKDGATAIRICLYAVLHVETFYSDIRPYGRVEPMNAFFDAANLLYRAGKIEEANLCLAILGWVSINTQQLSAERSAGIESRLEEELRETYFNFKLTAQQDPDWIPMYVDDPWRDWPPSDELFFAPAAEFESPSLGIRSSSSN